METDTFKTALPWAYDPDSKLLALARNLYREQNGEEIEMVAVHAGLECGTFKVLNPDLMRSTCVFAGFSVVAMPSSSLSSLA